MASPTNAAAVPLAPSPNGSRSPSPRPPRTGSANMNIKTSSSPVRSLGGSASPSPPPGWTLRPDTTGGSTGHSSPQHSRFSINRANSGRSSASRSNGGGGSSRPFAGGRRGSRASFSRTSGARRRRGPGGFRGAMATASSTAGSLWRWANASGNHIVAFYIRLTPMNKILFLALSAVSFTLGVLMLVYSHRIFAALGPMAKGWHDLKGGWILIWLLVFITGFPPIIGYSTACTLAGVVYGFPWGWPIAASANVVGSLAAFLASRGVLSRYVDRLVGSDHRFVALSQVLRHDGLWVLAAVRFCPLPYSLSNGFLATIPSITPLNFALSTAMASPKLLVHVFIGSRLAKLAEEGDSMSAGAKAINYISMAIFGLVGVGVGLFIFRRTMARAAEIAEEEAQQEEGRVGGPRAAGVYADTDAADYDDNAPLMDPEDADVAALMDDDDISLWAADHFADGDGGEDEDGGDVSASSANNKNHSRNSSYHDESDGETGGRSKR
ncbi:Tlg2-vesicle protein [Sporothrix stenoceras]|uniref:Golgi apparatus membrane protein TVP38 n=1 Tax=Sporothrix stenoceras TaxID=5173 RepID=A0ABR3YJQ4_9PEZI